MTFYIDTSKTESEEEISFLLKKCMLHHPDAWNEIVFLCVGTDRITGDCLGPYVGQRLKEQTLPGVFVYGTLYEPVHALNLKKTAACIRCQHPHALVIAVDSSLGQKKHLGFVTIANGALHPGAAVHKELPPVGHIHITGIVNTAGSLEQLTLQTTRLSTVFSLAGKITRGIQSVIREKNLFNPLEQELYKNPAGQETAAAKLPLQNLSQEMP